MNKFDEAVVITKTEEDEFVGCQEDNRFMKELPATSGTQETLVSRCQQNQAGQVREGRGAPHPAVAQEACEGVSGREDRHREGDQVRDRGGREVHPHRAGGEAAYAAQAATVQQS